MKKWKCTVCGYVVESETAPEKCPVCSAPASAFEEITPASGNGSSKKWRCTVCGYIAEGEEPPAKCPVCAAPASKFEEVKAEPATKASKKWKCTVCGYIAEGTEPPAKCPVCGAPASKFEEVKPLSGDGVTFVDGHVLGVAKDVPEDIKQGLRDNFNGECSEVGMYLAMARVAYREGYPEIGLYYEKAAHEEAEHAAKFAELLGEVLTDSTEANLKARVEAEAGACEGKKALATEAKKQNLDAIHDTVHEMCKDEARHGQAFAGLLKRYFG